MTKRREFLFTCNLNSLTLKTSKARKLRLHGFLEMEFQASFKYLEFFYKKILLCSLRNLCVLCGEFLPA